MSKMKKKSDRVRKESVQIGFFHEFLVGTILSVVIEYGLGKWVQR